MRVGDGEKEKNYLNCGFFEHQQTTTMMLAVAVEWRVETHRKSWTFYYIKNISPDDGIEKTCDSIKGTS
jgi:hypothetical protein